MSSCRSSIVPATRLARLILSFDQYYRSTAVIYPLLTPSLFLIWCPEKGSDSVYTTSKQSVRRKSWTVDMDMVFNLPAYWTPVGVGALFEAGLGEDWGLARPGGYKSVFHPLTCLGREREQADILRRSPCLTVTQYDLGACGAPVSAPHAVSYLQGLLDVSFPKDYIGQMVGEGRVVVVEWREISHHSQHGIVAWNTLNRIWHW